MIAAVVHLAAQTLTAAVAATGRPVLTLFLVQAAVGAAVRGGAVEIDAVLAPVVSFVAVGVMAVLALVEALVQHQSEVAELLDDVYLQRIGGAASAAVSTLILASLGAPGAPPNGEIFELIRLASDSPHSTPLTLVAIAVAAVVSLALGWIRAQVLESLRDADMDGPFAWLETGGAVAALLLLPILPLLALLLVVLGSAGLVAVALVARTTEWLVDKGSRRPCPACDERIRVEASVCPSCGQPVDVAFSLAATFAERPSEQAV